MKRIFSQIRLRFFKRKKSKKKQSGQAMVEFLLMFLIAISFTRFMYFNPNFGVKGMIDGMMLRLGSFLEHDLKSGTRSGDIGQATTDTFCGINAWNN